MVGEPPRHLLDRHGRQPGAIQDAPRGLRAGQAGRYLDLAVFFEGKMQFRLRPEADQNSGQHHKQNVFQVEQHNSKGLTAAPEIHSKRKRPAGGS